MSHMPATATIDYSSDCPSPVLESGGEQFYQIDPRLSRMDRTGPWESNMRGRMMSDGPGLEMLRWNGGG